MSITDCSITNVLASNYCPIKIKKGKFSFIATVDAVERSFLQVSSCILRKRHRVCFLISITPAVQTLERARDKRNETHNNHDLFCFCFASCRGLRGKVSLTVR